MNISRVIFSEDVWRQNVPSSGNFTDLQWITSYMVFAFIYLVLLGLCNIGTIMIFILTLMDTSRNRSSLGYYVMATAAGDLCALWFGFPNFLWNISARLKLPYYTPGNKDIMYVTRAPVIWGQEASLVFSDWLLVFFSTERLVVVVYDPLKYRHLKRPKIARITITIVLFIALAFTLFNFVNNFYLWRGNLWNAPQLRPLWLIQWDTVQKTAEVACRLGTFLVLLLLNCPLVCFLHRYKPPQSHAQGRKLRRKDHRSNIILLSCAFLFIVCRTPSVIYSCLQIADQHHSFDFTPSARTFYAPIVNAMQYFNYSMKFYVYLATDKKCRQEFCRLCRFVCIAAHSRFGGAKNRCGSSVRIWHSRRTYIVQTSSESVQMSDLQKGLGVLTSMVSRP